MRIEQTTYVCDLCETKSEKKSDIPYDLDFVNDGEKSYKPIFEWNEICPECAKDIKKVLTKLKKEIKAMIKEKDKPKGKEEE